MPVTPARLAHLIATRARPATTVRRVTRVRKTDSSRHRAVIRAQRVATMTGLSVPQTRDVVTTARLARSTVTTAPLARSIATTAPLARSTVTTAPLARSTVTTARLARSTATDATGVPTAMSAPFVASRASTRAATPSPGQLTTWCWIA